MGSTLQDIRQQVADATERISSMQQSAASWASEDDRERVSHHLYTSYDRTEKAVVNYTWLLSHVDFLLRRRYSFGGHNNIARPRGFITYTERASLNQIQGNAQSAVEHVDVAMDATEHLAEACSNRPEGYSREDLEHMVHVWNSHISQDTRRIRKLANRMVAISDQMVNTTPPLNLPIDQVDFDEPRADDYHGNESGDTESDPSEPDSTLGWEM